MGNLLSRSRNCFGGLKSTSCRGLLSRIDHYTLPFWPNWLYSSAVPLAEKWACMMILPYRKKSPDSHQLGMIFRQFSPGWTIMRYCPWCRTPLSPDGRTGTVFCLTAPSSTRRSCCDLPSLPHRFACLVWPVRDRWGRCWRATPPCSRILPSAPWSHCLSLLLLSGFCLVRQRPLLILDPGWMQCGRQSQCVGDWHRMMCWSYQFDHVVWHWQLVIAYECFYRICKWWLLRCQQQYKCISQ